MGVWRNGTGVRPAVAALVVGALCAPAASVAASEAVDIVVLGGSGVVSDLVLDHLSGCTTGSVTRLGGATRYDTAAAVASSVFDTADLAYVATGENFPDAVAAASAAAADAAPILLTSGSALSSATAAELSRLGVTELLLLGGEGAIDTDVEARLETYGATTRLAGTDRYATAAAISEERFETAATVYVATGEDYPDALAAGPVAVTDEAPVLLVAKDTIPTATRRELERLQPTEIVILGGSGVVGDSVEAELGALAPGSVTRLAGSDRYATAAAASARGFPTGAAKIYVATGTDFPDALAGGAVAGHVGGPVLLVKAFAVPSSTAAEIARLTGTACSAFSFAPVPSFVQAWGATGSAPGQFDYPAGVAVGPDGSVFVADLLNLRVQRFSPGGAFLDSFGVFPPPPDSCSICRQPRPRAIAVAPSGEIYVANEFGLEIQQYDSGGNLIHAFGSDSSSLFGFSAVDVAPDGTLYAFTFVDVNSVVRFSSDGEFINSWGHRGPGEDAFWGNDIAVGPDGIVYVSNYVTVDDDDQLIIDNRVLRFTSTGQFIDTWHLIDLVQPSAVEVGPDNTVYVAVSDSGTIHRYTSDGVFIASWGVPGSGPGEFSGPIQLKVDGDTVYVIDGSDRVQKFAYP